MALVTEAKNSWPKVSAFALLLLSTLCPYQSLALDDSAKTPDVNFPRITISDVNDQSQVSYIIRQFQEQLSRWGFNSIVTCDHVTQLRYQYKTGRPGYSYGAKCSFSNGPRKPSVLICDEMMIGKFTLGGSDPQTRDGIAHFVEKNCSPGG